MTTVKARRLSKVARPGAQWFQGLRSSAAAVRRVDGRRKLAGGVDQHIVQLWLQAAAAGQPEIVAYPIELGNECSLPTGFVDRDPTGGDFTRVADAAIRDGPACHIRVRGANPGEQLADFFLQGSHLGLQLLIMSALRPISACVISQGQSQPSATRAPRAEALSRSAAGGEAHTLSTSR